MDQRLILAVAGSGKTRYLIDRLNLEKRFLIVTYTINNYKNIKKRVLKKFGYIPENISIRTFFSFLLNFCYKPFFHYKLQERGVTWKDPPDYTRYRKNWTHYMSNNYYLFHNRLAKLCLNETESVKNRLERYYDCFYFDEIQDLAGYDFDFVQSIVPQNKDVLFVGDFFQHTFDTSRDGNKNSGLYDDLNIYLKRWKEILPVDQDALSKSYRCSNSVCTFVSEKIGIKIVSALQNSGSISCVDDENKIAKIMGNDAIPKLFYQNSKKYDCFSMNWGDSKGLDDFTDVCVALNKTTSKLYEKGELNKMAEMTRNKFYVACTRAKRNLYFVAEEKMKDFLRKD